MHKSVIIATVLCAATLLTACQAPPAEPEITALCEPVNAGPASNAVSAAGGDAGAPRVKFADLPAVATTERTVVQEGSGRLANPGSVVIFDYSVYDGTTGVVIDQVGYDGDHVQAVVGDDTLQQGFLRAIACSAAGSRIAAVIPAEEAFGPDGAEQFDISGMSSVVAVIDIVAVAAKRATGEKQPVTDSLPKVNLGGTGEPRITIPPVSPPETLRSALLKRGDGEEVQEGSLVTVEYVGVVWKSGRVFDTTWYREPIVQRTTTSFIDGFGASLVGAPVGSQVLVTVPPSFGYGAGGSEEFGIEPDDTLVFVIDILATVQPPAGLEEE